jgi:class 3 adenylate cyclase
VVQQNHGDTIKFCGDAVMIMWSVDLNAEEEVKSAAVLMASLCALQLLGDCGIYDRGEGNHAVSLRLHCGIGCGEVHCMCVGEAERWEFLISGDPMRQVGIAEPEAGLGEVCLSPEAYARVQNKLETVIMPKGSHKLTGSLSKAPAAGLNSQSALFLLQEEEDSFCIVDGEKVMQIGEDSFEDLPVQRVDTEGGNPFSTDGYSVKRTTPLDLTNLGKLSDEEDEDDMPVKSKHQVNAKYAPLGGGGDIMVNPSMVKQNKSYSSGASGSASANASVLGTSIRSAKTGFHDLEAMMDASDNSMSPFPAAVVGKGEQTSAFANLFSCFREPQISPAVTHDSLKAASITDSPPKRERVELAAKSSSTINPSPLMSLDDTPSPSPEKNKAFGKKKSFIGDLGQRMRKGTDSFIFPTRRASQSNLDVDSAFIGNSLDVQNLKNTLRLDRDPYVAKARNYLNELTINPNANAASYSGKAIELNASMSKGLSTFNSDKYNDQDEVIMANMLRRFIHEAALKAIDSDLVDFGYLAEKRIVVTMFIELIGLEEDFRTGEVRRPQRAMSFALACLHRYEGSLRQYVVDDKGCVLIAAFGLPGSHHEDNCTRAVETAKAIQKSLEIMNITSRTGIAMGSVYCGLVGSKARCEYAMMGSSVNLAARLMAQCSPGFVAVNDTVYQGANQDFEFQTLEPINAKGYENKVEVYCPMNRVQSRTIGLGNRLNQHCKFVGRTEEKLMFNQDLMNFGYGKYSTERTIGHIIEGPPGMGKTSLIAEINEMCQSNANISAIVIASASASHMSSSYFVIRQILDFIMGLDVFVSRVPANSNKRSKRSGSVTNKQHSGMNIDLLSKKSESFNSEVEEPRGHGDPHSAPENIYPHNSASSSPYSNPQGSIQTPLTKSEGAAPSIMSNSIVSKSISRSYSRSVLEVKSADVEDHLLKSPVSNKSLSMRMKSAMFNNIEKSSKFATSFMDASFHKVNAIEMLRDWLEGMDEEVMISELEPIGVFENGNNPLGRANSYEVIYGTGGTTTTNSEKGDKSAHNPSFNPSLNRSRSEFSTRGDDDVGDETKLSFPMLTLLPLLSDILSVECKENSVTSTLTPAMRWRMGDALIVQILKMAMNEDKLVFIVENLQWCDYQSLSVLFYLIRDTVGGLFIGTERPVDSSMTASTARSRGRYSRMMASMHSMCHTTTLRPLFDIEVQRIMEQVVGADNLDPFPMLKTSASVLQIMRRTSGLPFAVIALCLALKTAIKTNKFVDINRLSSGVHNIILNRFDQLSNTEKVVLKIASIIGREFDFQLLKQSLTELHYTNCTYTLYHTLEQLVDAKLIRKGGKNDLEDFDDEDFNDDENEVRIPDHGTFEFVDQSVQGGIYNLLLGGQREIAHGVIGSLFEHKYLVSHGDAVLFAEVVHHFNLSSVLDKKMKYLRLAGKNAEAHRDYKMAIHYHSELIKFATNLSLEQLIERCCGKGEQRPVNKPKQDENIILQKLISAHHGVATKVAGDLRVVRNIFAARSGTEHHGSPGTLSPSDGWLALKKVLKQVTVIDAALGLGVGKDDVCRWISVVADAESRIGMFHWGNNLSIVALGSFNCSLLIDNTCTGFLKRKLHLQHIQKCSSNKILKKALSCYENLAFLQLMRGYPDVALGVLKMATKGLEQCDHIWLSEMNHHICLLNALYSMAYLGVGELSKAHDLLAVAQMQKSTHFDAYTNSIVTYINSFHLAARGSFQEAYGQCMESVEVLAFIGEAGLTHLICLSAAWYAFLLGDVGHARELYQDVFEYGLSTAHRPLIKMSMELYAAILILNSDFTSANAILDHLKSPLQTIEGSDASVRPSSIKSSLIAMSCVLDHRFVAAIPHIQFSCRVLSDINPTNPICGVFLFFAAFSALEVLLNVASLSFQERVTANIVLNEAVQLSMHALARCSLSNPCLKLLHKACEIKRCCLNADATLQHLIDLDVELVSIARPLREESASANFTALDLHSTFRHSSQGSPSASVNSDRFLPKPKLRCAWDGVGDVGLHDEFAFGKLFLHRERSALCKHLGVGRAYLFDTFDSAFLTRKLQMLYARENSHQNLKMLSEAGGARSSGDMLSPSKSEKVMDDVFDDPIARAYSGRKAEDSSLKQRAASIDEEDAVNEQLEKLRAYEMRVGFITETAPHIQRHLSQATFGTMHDMGGREIKNHPRKLIPLGFKINPELSEDEILTPLKSNRKNRRGSV